MHLFLHKVLPGNLQVMISNGMVVCARFDPKQATMVQVSTSFVPRERSSADSVLPLSISHCCLVLKLGLSPLVHISAHSHGAVVKSRCLLKLVLGCGSL